jgi:23S rRNA pseudouridine2605 synthase/16S rRNA pseudouridine516 synthase
LQRLQKVLAAAGVGSRRACEEIIASGRVSVDGEIVTKLGTQVDPTRSVVAVDGEPVHLPRKKVYLALHKPSGYVSTSTDPWGRPTIMELVEAAPGLHSVGRLDADSEGLLLLTNDGDLTYLLTHPRHEVDKTYIAEVLGRPAPDKLRRLRQGVMLEDGKTAPARARMVQPGETVSLVEITIHEGRKRQVKRMFEAIGHPVRSLCRVRIGPIELGSLRSGKWRRLSPEEVETLRRAAQPT